MHRHRDTQKGIDGFELFTYQTEGYIVESRAAVLFRDADAEQIQLGHLLKDFRMRFLLLVPFFDVWRNFFLRKFADGLHQGLVVVGKLKFDHISTDYTDYTDLE